MKRKNSLQLTNNSPIAISPGKAQKRREEEIQVITLLEIERMFRIAILEKIAVHSSGEKKSWQRKIRSQILVSTPSYGKV